MTVTLKIAQRTKTAQVERKEGNIPGVVYGPKQTPISVTMSRIDIDKVVAEAGESSIVTLEGLASPIEVLIQDVAFNAKRGGIEHVDFYAIEKGKKLTTNVPLQFEGEAPAVKLGGVLTKVLHDVEVTCRPSDLPHHLMVDVSSLVDFETQIKVSDIVVPAGVTIDTDGDEVVAIVSEVEDEPEEIAAVDMNAVEVTPKGKVEAE
jgi:large subunit ribosomal protein L25